MRDLTSKVGPKPIDDCQSDEIIEILKEILENIKYIKESTERIEKQTSK